MYLRLLKPSYTKKSVVEELLHGGINCNCKVAVLPVAGKVLVDNVNGCLCIPEVDVTPSPSFKNISYQRLMHRLPFLAAIKPLNIMLISPPNAIWKPAISKGVVGSSGAF